MSIPSLEITTMIGCPLMCSYCPQDTLRTGYGNDTKYLSFDNFKKVIDNLPKNYRIDFSGMAEAWANPEATKMFKYTLEQGHDVILYTTLYNWNKSDVDTVVELFEIHAAQIKTVCIHLPDKNGNMPGWRYSEDWEYAFKIISTAAQRIPGINFRMMTMDHHSIPHEEVKIVNFTKMSPWIGHSRSGSLPLEQIKSQPIIPTPRWQGPIGCLVADEYNQNVLLPNGDVLICCNDYARKHVIGNLFKNTIDEIRQQEPFKRLMELNSLSEFNSESACRTCALAKPL